MGQKEDQAKRWDGPSWLGCALLLQNEGAVGLLSLLLNPDFDHFALYERLSQVLQEVRCFHYYLELFGHFLLEVWSLP